MAATEEEEGTRAPAATVPPEEIVAAERRRAPRAAASAIGAALLTLAGSLLALAPSGEFPSVRLVESLRVNLGLVPEPQPGLIARKVLYFDDNLAQVVAVQVVPALALALAGAALTFLYLAIRARNPQGGRMGLIAAVSGAVVVVVAALVTAVSLALNVSGFAGSARQTDAAARDVLESPVTQTGAYLVSLGTFTLGLAFVLTSLHAMRVGLLTRFMGVLGILVGVLFVLPLEAQIPLVKIFWLLALGALFLGRWPGGPPPAWAAGEPRPWPSRQELRERALEARAERGAEGLKAERPARGRRRAEPPETPAPEPPPSRSHPSSKKRRRKRR